MRCKCKGILQKNLLKLWHPHETFRSKHSLKRLKRKVLIFKKTRIPLQPEGLQKRALAANLHKKPFFLFPPPTPRLTDSTSQSTTLLGRQRCIPKRSSNLFQQPLAKEPCKKIWSINPHLHKGQIDGPRVVEAFLFCILSCVFKQTSVPPTKENLYFLRDFEIPNHLSLQNCYRACQPKKYRFIRKRAWRLLKTNIVYHHPLSNESPPTSGGSRNLH